MWTAKPENDSPMFPSHGRRFFTGSQTALEEWRLAWDRLHRKFSSLRTKQADRGPFAETRFIRWNGSTKNLRVLAGLCRKRRTAISSSFRTGWTTYSTAIAKRRRKTLHAVHGERRTACIFLCRMLCSSPVRHLLLLFPRIRFRERHSLGDRFFAQFFKCP